MSAAKLNIRTMPSGRLPVGKEKFAAPLDTALPQPDRNTYTYIVADDYMMAIEYAHKHDLPASTTRYVSCADVLKGVERPRVIVISVREPVSEAIVEALARRHAEVSYDQL